jgi:hypothetical protein
MARQGSAIESRVGKGSLEDNSFIESSKSPKGNNWEECNSLEKCNTSKECISLEDMNLKEGRLEENSVGKSNLGNGNKSKDTRE